MPSIWDLFGMGQTGDNPWVPPATPAMGAPAAWMGAGAPAPLGQPPDIMKLIASLFTGEAAPRPGISELLPNFGNMAGGLGLTATMPSQQTERLPIVPQVNTSGAVSEAARAVLPERSPLMSLLSPRVPDPTPIPPTAAESQFKWPAAPTGGPTSITIPGRGGVAAPAGGVGTPGAPSATAPDITASLLRKFEGYRDTPYWDVNAHRVGYGSDTITEPTGTIRSVKPGDKITKDDAERDLSRRVTEFSGTASRQIGQDVWDKLPENVKAGLTSVAYNYGSLPDKVAAAAKTGNAATIASAVEGLKTDNQGINADRRTAEAGVIRTGFNANAFGLPNAPVTSAPQLPTPPTLQAMKGIDPAVYDQFLKQRAMMAPPMTMADRVTNLLGRGAAAVVGQKTAGDVLAAFGGGVGQGASENLARERGELQQGADRSQDLLKQFAGVGVKKEEAKVEGQNLQTDAANKNAMLLNQVKTEQAKLDAAAKNANVGAQFQLDLKAFEMGQPQLSFSKDGDTVHIATRQPDGGYKIDQMNLGESVHDLTKKVADVKGVLGDRGTPLVSMYEDAAITKLAKGNPALAKEIAVQKVVREAVTEGLLSKVLPKEQAQKLEKDAEAGLDIKRLGNDAKGYQAQKEAALHAILMKERAKNPAAFEKLFITGMAGLNNSTAQRLIAGGR